MHPLPPLLSFSAAAGSFSLPHIISLLISYLVFLLFGDSVSSLRVTYRNTGNYQWPYHWRNCPFLPQQPLPAHKSQSSRTSWLLLLSIKWCQRIRVRTGFLQTSTAATAQACSSQPWHIQKTAFYSNLQSGSLYLFFPLCFLNFRREGIDYPLKSDIQP